MLRLTIRPRDLPGATPSERRAWTFASIPMVVGCVTLGVGVGTGNVLVLVAGSTLLLVTYVLMFTVVLRLQRRANMARLAELAADRAATFERHRKEIAELDELRREVLGYRERHGSRDDAS